MLLEVRLGLRVNVHVTGTRHSQPCPEAPQIRPAELTADLSSEAPADPGSDRPPAPVIALGCCAGGQRCYQRVLLRCGQQPNTPRSGAEGLSPRPAHVRCSAERSGRSNTLNILLCQRPRWR
jgi:hypothetical protein